MPQHKLIAVQVKNIIFDLGGILLKVNYQKTEDAFVALGITNFSDFYKQDYVSTLFEDLEIGKISSQEFYDGIREIAKKDLSNEQIETAWNAIIESFWLDRLQWLNVIKQDYNIFLFSNTNAIHYNYFIKLYNQLNLPNSFSHFFVKDYYSHIMHLRKPNANSFNYILQEQNLIANETLFIDDTLKNIEGAQAVGLQTLLLLPNMNLQQEVEKYLH